MKEFFQAVAISLAFTLGGYLLFGALFDVPEGDGMEGVDMSQDMQSMPGMNH